jgi:phage pi2 protein 07
MNERIRELAEQATDKWVGGEFFDREKFAELIIAECCVALHPMLRDMISRTQAVDMIVSHFRDEQDV